MQRSSIPRAVLAFALGCAMLVAAELTWRVLRSGGFGPTTNPYYVVHDDELGWRYRRAARARHATDEFDVAIEIDERCLRRVPHSAGAAAGGSVAVLGDSFAFGWGVDASDVFTVELERQLGRRVDNLGVSGYDTGQELLLWRRQRDASDVHLVVLTVCENDVAEIVSSHAYGRGKPKFARSGDRDVWLPVNLPLAESRWLRYSHLLRSVHKAALRWRSKARSPDTELGRSTIVALLAALRADCAERGAALLVAADSSPWLAEPLARHEIPFCDLSHALSAASTDDAVRFPVDGHWTPHGHRTVATALVGFIRAHGLLDG